MLADINGINTRISTAKHNNKKEFKKLRKDLLAKNDASSNGNFNYLIDSRVEAEASLPLNTLQNRVEVHELYLCTNFAELTTKFENLKKL